MGIWRRDADGAVRRRARAGARVLVEPVSQVGSDIDDSAIETSGAKGSDAGNTVGAGAGELSLAEDEVTDFITGNAVKLKGNEEVRQRIARALFHEYGISDPSDMQRDFPIP